MTDLSSFVQAALQAGASRDKIQSALKKAGWQQDEIKNALSNYADIDFPIPVPKRKPYLSARETFIYLVLFFCLYISAFSVGTILFQVINLWIPDATTYDYGSIDTIRSATSALIITFPLYAWLTHYINKRIKADPDRRTSKIRKWLTYLTLFIAASVIIGTLIGLVNSLLFGELTLRFGLKVLTILAISGSLFGYYLYGLREDEDKA